MYFPPVTKKKRQLGFFFHSFYEGMKHKCLQIGLQHLMLSVADSSKGESSLISFASDRVGSYRYTKECVYTRVKNLRVKENNTIL